MSFMNAVDTNVLVYAYDTRDAVRQQRAVELLGALSPAVLLWQVGCEFLAASRKLSGAGLTPMDAWAHLDDLLRMFPLVTPSAGVLVRARGMMAASQVQFWDAMIYAACLEAGVTRMYSEDLPGAPVLGLEIVNPFA